MATIGSHGAGEIASAMVKTTTGDGHSILLLEWNAQASEGRGILEGVEAGLYGFYERPQLPPRDAQ